MLKERRQEKKGKRERMGNEKREEGEERKEKNLGLCVWRIQLCFPSKGFVVGLIPSSDIDLWVFR